MARTHAPGDDALLRLVLAVPKGARLVARLLPLLGPADVHAFVHFVLRAVPVFPDGMGTAVRVGSLGMLPVYAPTRHRVVGFFPFFFFSPTSVLSPQSAASSMVEAEFVATVLPALQAAVEVGSWLVGYYRA